MGRPKALIAAVFALGALLAAPPVVAGRDDSPPETTLKAAPLEIAGAPWTYTWTFDEQGEGCATVVADGRPEYDETPPRVGGETSRAKLVLHRAKRPRHVRLFAYSRLDADGFPAGGGQRLAVELIPGHRGSEITSWRAAFDLAPKRRYYLNASVAYRGSGSCGAGGGSMDLAFSFRTP